MVETLDDKKTKVLELLDRFSGLIRLWLKKNEGVISYQTARTVWQGEANKLKREANHEDLMTHQRYLTLEVLLENADFNYRRNVKDAASIKSRLNRVAAILLPLIEEIEKESDSGEWVVSNDYKRLLEKFKPAA